MEEVAHSYGVSYSTGNWGSVKANTKEDICSYSKGYDLVEQVLGITK